MQQKEVGGVPTTPKRQIVQVPIVPSDHYGVVVEFEKARSTVAKVFMKDVQASVEDKTIGSLATIKVIVNETDIQQKNRQNLNFYMSRNSLQQWIGIHTAKQAVNGAEKCKMCQYSCNITIDLIY